MIVSITVFIYLLVYYLHVYFVFRSIPDSVQLMLNVNFSDLPIIADWTIFASPPWWAKIYFHYMILFITDWPLNVCQTMNWNMLMLEYRLLVTPLPLELMKFSNYYTGVYIFENKRESEADPVYQNQVRLRQINYIFSMSIIIGIAPQFLSTRHVAHIPKFAW